MIGVTGSTGKTSTKDLLLALLAPHRRTVASRANFNTEIGLPLEILNAPAGTEVLVLEMGMRGKGQIAELAEIAEPDVAVIVSIGPVHLELLGSIEAIAAAKAELIAGLPAGGTAIVPAGEPLLEPHLRDDVTTVTFGPRGDVRLSHAERRPRRDRRRRASASTLEVPFTQAHLRSNLLAAVAAARAVGVTPTGRVELALSAGRGQRYTTPSRRNSHRRLLQRQSDLDARRPRRPQGHRRRRRQPLAASPCSATCSSWDPRSGSSTLELGEQADRGRRRRAGDRRAAGGVDRRALRRRDPCRRRRRARPPPWCPSCWHPGDVVLVKASRGVGLELVCRALGAGEDDA